MPTHFLKWRGQNVLAKILDDVRKGADVTTADCVVTAKTHTPVISGTLQGSIKAEGAVIQGKTVVARWGSFDVNYALVVEMRVMMLRRAADAEYPKFRNNIKRFSMGP